jgi:uncharacterized protein with GYD domain
MPKFVIFFSYTPETWARMIEKPSDRTAGARQAVEGTGGTLESIYFMFGDRDALVIFDAPDAEAAAASAVAVGSTGAFKHLETRQLIAPQDLPTILEKAGSVRERYTPPGT